MPDRGNWNAKIIREFRANQGRVGGFFEGAPIMLVHHRGRKTGREYVTPVMYLPSDDDRETMYIFATKQGAPDNPAWYYNLIHAGTADVEVGDDDFPVSVSEVTGDQRDRVYAEQTLRYPNFGEYAEALRGSARSRCLRYDAPQSRVATREGEIDMTIEENKAAIRQYLALTRQCTGSDVVWARGVLVASPACVSGSTSHSSGCPSTRWSIACDSGRS